MLSEPITRDDVGKMFLAREGQRTRVTHCSNDTVYPVACDNVRRYTAHGRDAFCGPETQFDLISREPKETVMAQQVFVKDERSGREGVEFAALPVGCLFSVADQMDVLRWKL